MVNNKTFEHRPISELLAIVKNDFRKFDEEGLIDEGTLIKTVMYCNDKLGLPIREIREVAIPVRNHEAELPVDFEKLYYMCGLKSTQTYTTNLPNPFNNNFDQDIIYEACLDRKSLGCVENYNVVIKRETKTTIHSYDSWINLSLSPSSEKYCYAGCPMKGKPGQIVSIKDGILHTPFQEGEIYLMYIGMMRDVDGNITFPFHPMLTPYYEWSVKEKVLEDAIFNADATNIGELYQLASKKRLGAWLDAFNLTTDQSYREFKESLLKIQTKWYNQYFRYFQ